MFPFPKVAQDICLEGRPNFARLVYSTNCMGTRARIESFFEVALANALSTPSGL